MRKLTSLFIAVAFFNVTAARAEAQQPIHVSVSGGLALPIRSEADYLTSGYHLAAALKIGLIPLQLDAGYDRMGGKDNAGSLGVKSFGLSVPIGLTRAHAPISAYLVAGGGVYQHKSSDVSATNMGLNAGGGVLFGVSRLSIFSEARGVAVFADGNRLTYTTLGVGIRF